MSKPIILRAKALDVSVKVPDVTGNLLHFDSIDQWQRAARRRFGADKLKWAFVCHHCGTIYSAADAVYAKMPQDQIGFSCIGPYEPSVNCTYNGRNKMPPNPVTVLVAGQTARMLSFAGD